MIFSSGWRVQAPTPARASDAPINFRNCRRPAGSLNSEAWAGNSRWTYSLELRRVGELLEASPIGAAFETGESRADVSQGSWLNRTRSGVAATAGRPAIPVADRATRHVLDARHAVRCIQVAAQLELAPEFPRSAPSDDDRPVTSRLLVGHVEDFFTRPQVLLRRAMAVEAELHEQRLRLVHERHLVHRPMARHAADALFHVDLVIEIHEIW